ncbi:hypothetical protein CHCC20375_2574 [Bacillus licheniformis]|nr:hypothetical protein CHCC20375_2574 [Bacillus licheniformis]
MKKTGDYPASDHDQNLEKTTNETNIKIMNVRFFILCSALDIATIV